MENKEIISRKIEELHYKVRAYVQHGLTNEEIIEKLREENLERYYIETIINNIQAEKDNKKNFRNSMIMGGFFLIMGILFNIFSYKFAERSSSSTFLLLWGIVVAGIITIIRGFILYRN